MREGLACSCKELLVTLHCTGNREHKGYGMDSTHWRDEIRQDGRCCQHLLECREALGACVGLLGQAHGPHVGDRLAEQKGGGWRKWAESVSRQTEVIKK